MKQPNVVEYLTASGIPVFPCWDNKQPAIAQGHHAATTTPANYWPTEFIGTPVPDGVIVLDIDLYKGITHATIENKLGCQLDWDAAAIQSTPNGGEHYAFRVNQLMHQRVNWFKREIGEGFDTRAYPAGYICTGDNYIGSDEIGILKLLMPEFLPELPPAAVEVLKKPNDRVAVQMPLPTGDKNTAEIQHMLSYLNADCGRDEWMTVLRALRHQYHDDEGTGWALFNNWSMTAEGKINSKGEPVYNEKEAYKQWCTTDALPKNGGTPVTIRSLVDMAIRDGYAPSSVASEVFGGGNNEQSVTLDVMEQLIADINAEGGKPEKVDEFTAKIRQLQCNSIQRASLTATLQRTLKDHGIKINEADMRKATAPQSAAPMVLPQPVAEVTAFRDLKVSPVDALGNVHIQNAGMLRQAIFGERLARFGDDIYWWNGVKWEQVSKSDLNATVAHTFIGSEFGKTGNIDGTDKQLRNMVPSHKELNPISRQIFFKNGVFDPMRPDLGVQAHNPDNFNGNTLEVDYTPGQPHPEWDKFLESIFHAEPERKTLLQELMGWCLINDNLGYQKAVALDGASRGGKGTIIDVLHNILGTGQTSITFGELHTKQTLSDMRGAMLAVDTDAKRPDRNNATAVHSRFNRVTANEPIDIKINFQQTSWVGRLNCKIMIASNGIPIMADDSSAAPRRWIILKFTEDFTGREDHGLGGRLKAETTAITAWAVEGLRRLIANGTFTLPQSSIKATEELTESSSPLILFANERMAFGEGKIVHSRLLWDAYKQWCSDTNTRHNITSYNFARLLKQVLVERGAEYAEKIPDGAGGRLRGYRGAELVPCTDGVAPNVTPISQALKEAPVS